MSSETEQVWVRTARKLHPIFVSEFDIHTVPVLTALNTLVPIGTNDNFGTEETLEPALGGKFMIPIALQYDIGGVFASGEQVTVRVKGYYSDGTVQTEDETLTTFGKYNFGPFDGPFIAVFEIIDERQRITKVGFQAKTNQPSTALTLGATLVWLEV